ncbi:MAG: WG repeat-containing protein, partial [Prevotellaceae bacterium]|nr:WG repeat-containing protein [Prevotellaceae bacterium]
GFIDKTGKEVTPCIYDHTEDFSEGLKIVDRDDKRGFIDKTGKEVIPCIYDDGEDFCEGFAYVRKNDKWGFIDKTGKEVTPFIYVEPNGFSEGLAMVERYLENGRFVSGFIDKTGKEVIPCIYDDASNFSEGLAIVGKGDHGHRKYGFIDKTGKEVIPCIFDDLWNFSEGLAKVGKGDRENRKYGFINKTGKEVIPCIFDYTERFSEGLARVTWNGQKGFIDKEGYFIGKGFVKGFLPETTAHVKTESNSQDEKTGNEKTETDKSASTSKNKQIKIQIKATVNSKSDYYIKLSNYSCNYSSGNWLKNEMKQIIYSGQIRVPTGKMWIYKSCEFPEESHINYTTHPVILTRTNTIYPTDRDFSGLILNEGDTFRVGLTGMNYNNQVRHSRRKYGRARIYIS